MVIKRKRQLLAKHLKNLRKAGYDDSGALLRGSDEVKKHIDALPGSFFRKTERWSRNLPKEAKRNEKKALKKAKEDYKRNTVGWTPDRLGGGLLLNLHYKNELRKVKLPDNETLLKYYQH